VKNALLFDFVFEAFPRLHQAKGPKRERQVLSSDKERVEQPPSLFTTDQSYAQDSANLQHYILLRDKLVTHAVIRATTVSTCNATMLRDKLKENVARFTGPLLAISKLKLKIEIARAVCA